MACIFNNHCTELHKCKNIITSQTDIFLTRPAADITAIIDVIHYHNKVIYLS